MQSSHLRPSKRSNRRTVRKLMELRGRVAPRLKPWLVHRRTQWLLDAFSGAFAIVLAYLFRYDFAVPAAEQQHMFLWALLLFFMTPVMFSISGGYRATWQFFGHRDLTQLCLRALPVCAILLLARFFSASHALIPYSVAIMEFGLVVCLASSVRMVRRLEHEVAASESGAERVLIVGTPETLVGAIRMLQPIYATGLKGLLVDDEQLAHMKIAGIPVLGVCSDLASAIANHNLSLIFVCAADFPGMTDIIQCAAEFDVPVKLLPSPQDLIDNRVRVSKVLSVDSIRGRKVVAATEMAPEVVRCLTGRTVLVTGAGGSIGSEIARQIANLGLAKLIVLDHNENAIFELLNELGRRPSLIPVIADIRDREAIRHLFESERPDVVLHAAAYKHVPMMELNPCESVLNNVAGTQILVDAAVEFYTERLVMISSDKAVRPSSVMGATKRVAEIVVQSKASRKLVKNEPQTHFACVRFGNVLGSRGSVLPIFLRQIANGGPVTVTHEDMTRYFMTIPQAVRLVLQAATLASSGDVYMLDMGDPVRIMDFAREVIELSGLTPGRDIAIEVVGTRPGEKLHEQLWSEDAHVVPTDFTHVFRVRAPKVEPLFRPMLDSLLEAAQERRADDVLQMLHSLPIDFLTEKTSRVAAVLTRV
jgi:FlaA1/EpsC-like NDP-sugar epimerase